jgi:hypothetical protein
MYHLRKWPHGLAKRVKRVNPGEAPYFADRPHRRPEKQLNQMAEKLEQGAAAKGGFYLMGFHILHIS